MFADTEVVLVTFGQIHMHVLTTDDGADVVLDHNMIAKVKGGRDEVFRIFGNKWFTTYPVEELDKLLRYCPGGVYEVQEHQTPSRYMEAY